MKIREKIIVFYGVSGHGKGLVDAINAFGVKNPLKSMVICENFQFDSSLDIFNGLREKFIEKENRHYYHIPLEDLLTYRANLEDMKLNGSSKFHVISFHPDGAVVAKDNICSCDSCVAGNLLTCTSEKGKLVRSFEELYSDTDMVQMRVQMMTKKTLKVVDLMMMNLEITNLLELQELGQMFKTER